MKTNHPIVISECPRCGKMDAARSPYLEPLKDEAGNPDLSRCYLMKIECFGCIEITPVPPPRFRCDPISMFYPSGAVMRFAGC